jgi:hypothetical protein
VACARRDLHRLAVLVVHEERAVRRADDDLGDVPKCKAPVAPAAIGRRASSAGSAAPAVTVEATAWRF